MSRRLQALLPIILIGAGGSAANDIGTEVALAFSITSPGKLTPANVSSADLKLYEDRAPQDILSLRREENAPLTLGIIVDVSGSQADLIQEHGLVTHKLLGTLLQPGDQAFLVSVATRVKLVVDTSASVDALSAGAQNLDKRQSFGTAFGDACIPAKWKGDCYGTALWNSVYYAAKLRMSTAGPKKAMILITDGWDRGSEHTLDEAIEAAQLSNTAVYAFRYPAKNRLIPAWLKHVDLRGLNRLAAETGGTVLEADQPFDADLPALDRELHTQYRLTYRSRAADPFKSRMLLRVNRDSLVVSRPERIR